MIRKLKVFAISGSIKKGSSNETILKFIEARFEEEIVLDLYEGVEQLPYFNPDLDQGNEPVSVSDFRSRVEKADAVIFSTPEYVFSLPGALKNAIEWTVSTAVFTDKPTALIVAAASGDKAMEALDLIMKTLQVQILPECKLIIKGIKAKITPSGIETTTVYQIDDLVSSLIKGARETITLQ